MSKPTPFVQRFSDDAAEPRPEFLADLRQSMTSTAQTALAAPQQAASSTIFGISRFVVYLLAGVVTMITLVLLLFLVLEQDQAEFDANPTVDESPAALTTDDSQVSRQDEADDVAQPDEQSTDDASEDTAPTAVDDTQAPQQTTDTADQTADDTTTDASDSDTTPPATTDYVFEYWNLSTFVTTPPTPKSSPVYTETLPSVSQTWGAGSPDASVQNDYFFTRATKTAFYTAGTYTVTYVADDGLRVYVNGNIVLDQWNNFETAGFTTFSLASDGDATVLIEHYERDANARLQVSISASAAPSL